MTDKEKLRDALNTISSLAISHAGSFCHPDDYRDAKDAVALLQAHLATLDAGSKEDARDRFDGAAQRIAAYANTCCGRSDGYEKDVERYARKQIETIISGAKAEIAKLNQECDLLARCALELGEDMDHPALGLARRIVGGIDYVPSI